MKITAAVVPARSAPFEIQTLDLTAPLADEALVRVVASGMCHTDLHARDGCSDLLDNTAAFVTANDRIGQVREIAITGMQIGVAHAAGQDPHKHFIDERRREVERLDLEQS